MFDQFIKQTVILVLIGSIGPLICSSALGLLVSIVQTATQIQEQSISFLVKFLVICTIMLCFGPWYLNLLIQLFKDFFSSVVLFGSMP